MNIPFLSRRDSGNERGLSLITALADSGQKCVLTTRSKFGEPHARRVRVSNYSMKFTPTLLFVIPKDPEIADDVARDASVVLSVMDPRTGALVHLEGTAQLFDGNHTPAYLHPSVQQQPHLHVVAGEVDFMLLRVEIPLIDGHVAETQPPVDMDLDLSRLMPKPRGAGSFLRGLLS
jgi:hypothetical protein